MFEMYTWCSYWGRIALQQAFFDEINDKISPRATAANKDHTVTSDGGVIDVKNYSVLPGVRQTGMEFLEHLDQDTLLEPVLH